MIYILEDDDNIRKLVSYALKKEGYDVLGFPEPGVFWEAMRNRIPELIMLDIMLPVEDGLSILKKIRNTSAYEDIPVIMLTAKSSEFDKASGLDRVNRGNSVGVSRETYKIGCLEVDNGKHSVTVNGESVELTREDLLIETAQTEGFVTQQNGSLTVVMDTNLTEELVEEGFVRELVSKIQTMRKEAGFEVQDHIDVYESGNDRIRGILEKFEEQLKKEVLAESVTYSDAPEGAYEKEWTVNGERVTLAVRKCG